MPPFPDAVAKAGGYAQYEKAHRTRLAAIFIPKLTRLPEGRATATSIWATAAPRQSRRNHLIKRKDATHPTAPRPRRRRRRGGPPRNRRRPGGGHAAAHGRLDASSVGTPFKASDDAADAASASKTQNDAHLPIAIVPYRDRPSAAAVLEESHFATSVKEKPSLNARAQRAGNASAATLAHVPGAARAKSPLSEHFNSAATASVPEWIHCNVPSLNASHKAVWWPGGVEAGELEPRRAIWNLFGS